MAKEAAVKVGKAASFASVVMEEDAFNFLDRKAFKETLAVILAGDRLGVNVSWPPLLEAMVVADGRMAQTPTRFLTCCCVSSMNLARIWA